MRLALVCSVLVLLSSHSHECIKVFKSKLTLAEDGKAISGAKLIDNRTVSVQDLTICMRFNFKLLGFNQGRSTLIYIEDWRETPEDPDFTLMWFGAYYPTSFFSFGYPRAHGSYNSFLLQDVDSKSFEIWATNRWTHICLSYEKETSFLRVVKDGRVTNINESYPTLANVVIPEDFISKVYIARCSFDFKNTCSSPQGEVADFNMWDRALSLDETLNWTTCRSMAKGNLVNWDRAQFDLVNMTIMDKTKDELCKPHRPGFVMFPELRNFTSHVALCKKFRGRHALISDNETMYELIRQFSQYPDQCGDIKDASEGRFWAGWSDMAKEGTFRDPVSKVTLTKDMFQPWYFGEPNGDIQENCVVVWATYKYWNDISCNIKTCSFCELERSPDIQIRGLCQGSKFDAKFSWTEELINEHHAFRGFSDSILYWDHINNVWKLQLYSDPTIYATVNSEEYPFGQYLWEVTGDNCSVGNDTSHIMLNLNACSDTEFNCNDGNCIAIDHRCDGQSQCPDKSDEIDCKIFTVDASYLKDVPPSPPDDRAKLEVMVSVTVLGILDISEVGNFISLQLELKLSWNDGRLTMVNLKEDQDMNTLTPEFRAKIWIPEIVFYNTQEKLESLNDEKTFASISRNGSYERSPKHALQNAYIFKGSENPITVSRVYNAEFICDFNMAVYPFDTQKCSVILILKGNRGKFVQMVVEQLQYLGPIDLAQYFIKETKITDFEVPSNIAAIKVEIVFGRRLLGTMLTTYLPTVLICLVSFSTNYFKAFFFEALVTVNLTSLLVLTTLFISISDGLPKTSYLKMVDIWLIFNLFIPFCEVLLHTFIDSLRSDDREVNHHGSVMGSMGNGLDHSPRKELVRSDTRGQFVNVRVGTARLEVETAKHIGDLTARNEEEELEARKNYYERARVTNEKHMMIATKIATKGLPFMFISFVVAYFAIGISFYNRGIKDI